MWVNRLVWLVLATVAGAGIAYLNSFPTQTATVLWILGCIVVAFTLLVWLPKVAHRRFVEGNYSRARLWYGILHWVVLHAKARGAVDVSIGAAMLAEGKYHLAREFIESVQGLGLSESVRAAWLNNRAYLRLRTGGDARSALVLCDRALALRPYVSGFHHTRGIALLALGRTDEAIGALDEIWEQHPNYGADTPFEAERCYDLGLAWARKGERDYALDYFSRVRRMSPESRWAERAAEFDTGQEMIRTPNLAHFL